MIKIDTPFLDLSYTPENHDFSSNRFVVEKVNGFELPEKLCISSTLNQLYSAENIENALYKWKMKYAVINPHIDIEVLQIDDTDIPIQMGFHPLYIMSMTNKPDFDFTIPLIGIPEKMNMYFKMYRMKKFVY